MQKNERRIFIGGNFKSNGDVCFIKSHAQFLNGIHPDAVKCQVAVFPSNIHLSLAKLEFNSDYIIGSQNVSMFDNGAYTGEVSAHQLKDLGIEWTLIGHSERRQFFGDTEKAISEKIKQSLNNGLNIVTCVGENLSEREENKTMEVIINQMKTIVSSVNDWSKVVIAYEPVWAIGTGKTASPEVAQEVHNGLRNWISQNVSESVAKELRIIYGGSVTDSNCNDLIKQNDIDGFLVGGASLKPSFKTIIESYDSCYSK